MLEHTSKCQSADVNKKIPVEYTIPINRCTHHGKIVIQTGCQSGWQANKQADDDDDEQSRKSNKTCFFLLFIHQDYFIQ